MATALVVAALGLEFNHFNLLALACGNDSTLNLCALDSGSSDSRVRAVVDQQHLVEAHLVAGDLVAWELLNENSVALGDYVLLPAGLDYGHFHSAINITFAYLKHKTPDSPESCVSQQ